MRDRFDLSVRQLTEAWRVICSSSDRYSSAIYDGLEMIFSGCSVPMFNAGVAYGDRISEAGLRDRVAQACQFASRSGLPWIFITTDETLDADVDASAVLGDCGFAPLLPMTGMVASHVDSLANAPDGLSLTVPDTDDACCALVDINCAGYGLDLAASKPFVGKQAFWADHFPVVGVENGKPVSCAAVLMVEGIRYVALVATDPAFQRRGFASAAMRRALEHAERSYPGSLAVLHASDAGRPVYERMGFEPVSRHMIFMEKRFMENH